MSLRLRSIFCLLSLPVLSLLAADKSHMESRVQLYYGLAEGNYLVGDLRGASRGIEQILRIHPDHQPTLQLKARVALDSGQPELALQVIEQALKFAPENRQNQLLKALILGNLNRRDEALELVQELQKGNTTESPDYYAANQLIGLLQMAEGDFDAAAEAFSENHLTSNRSHQLSRELTSDAYLEKARVAVDQREHETALEALNQAISVHSDADGGENFERLTQLRLIRARYLTQIGQHENAIEELRQLNNQQPENLEVLITLASLYASTGKWNEVEAIIDPIAAQPELQDVALYLKGRAALAKGRVGSARAYFEEALELLTQNTDPLRAYALFFHGVCLDKLGRFDAAETEILEALEYGFRPESSEDAINASRMLLRAQNHDRAIPLLESFALNQLIPNAEVWSMLGRAHQAKGQYALALSAFNESLALQPTQADTLGLRGTLLRRFGDLHGAVADYRSALNLEPNNSAILYALGLVQLQRGKLDAALSSIQMSNNQDEHPGKYLLTALLAYTINEPSKARQALAAYFRSASGDANETAYYLEYLLTARSEPRQALDQLRTRANHRDSSDELGFFLAYCKGLKSRKEVLDLAGQATTQEQASKQLCEAAYWLAQQEHLIGNAEQSLELLALATEAGNPDLIEFQLATWQLKTERPTLHSE